MKDKASLYKSRLETEIQEVKKRFCRLISYCVFVKGKMLNALTDSDAADLNFYFYSG